MSAETKIEWTDATLSPWIGCTRVSAGCAHCYLPTTTPARVHGVQLGGPRRRVKTFRAQALALNRKAERLGRRLRVFPSLCDWLDDEVPIEWLADLLDLIRRTPHLDWLLLTKRPQNWHERIRLARNHLTISNAETALWLAYWLPKKESAGMPARAGTPPANVWIGTTIENQKAWDDRAAHLLAIPARVRFLSVEPLLEAIDLRSARLKVASWRVGESFDGPRPLDGIHWVIVGGESGAGARPCVAEHVLDVVYQCREAGVPVFVKQLGSQPVTTNATAMEWPDATRFVAGGEGAAAARVILRSRKGGDMEEWPEELQVREYPEVHHA